MLTKTPLLTLLTTSLISALPCSRYTRRESPTTWQIPNYELTNNTGNGLTYSFQISGEAPDEGFKTLCIGSTLQVGLRPCVQNSAVTAVVHSTGTVGGLQGFEVQAAFAGATGETVTPGPGEETSFEGGFVEG